MSSREKPVESTSKTGKVIQEEGGGKSYRVKIRDRGRIHELNVADRRQGVCVTCRIHTCGSKQVCDMTCMYDVTHVCSMTQSHVYQRSSV